MSTLGALLYASSRRPSVTLRLAGRIAQDVLRVRAAAAYGSDGIGSGTVVLRSPPVVPTQGQSISWTWGYNGQEIPGFTGYVIDVQKTSYPDTWELSVRDVLWLASREQRAIATVPLNSITANDAITYILTTYAGLTRISLPTITRPSGGTWTLGTQTPVSWSRTTALAACQQICKDAGFALYADAGGTVRATLIERRPTDNPVWTFVDGRDFLDDAPPVRRRDGSAVRNRITVRGAATGVGGAQLSDTYLAPHVLYPGVVASEQYSSELLESIADVTAVAERITGLLNRNPDAVTFGALFNPYLALAQTIAVRDPYIGLTSAAPYFVYSLDSELDLEHGRARQTIVADGGLGDSGYSLIPPPTAVIAVTKLVAEALNGAPVVEVFLDGSGSISNTDGEIVSWAWATTTPTYSGTPTTASGPKAVFVYPGATATAEISLTVTDTSSKIDSVAMSINLAGDALNPLGQSVISLALGSAWAVSPDGGATWNIEATGDATLVPESGPLIATRAAGSTGLRGTPDALASASTALASLGGTITALSCTPDTSRVWAAVGTSLRRSTDNGATFALWGTLPASVTAILEDPAVPNSVFVLAGATLYHATSVVPGTVWTALYTGPSGAIARHLVRGASGATTWICYTGTFVGSPLHRVEGPVTAVFPVVSPPVSEIRAIALSPDEATVYAWDSAGRAFAVASDTGIGTAVAGGDLAAGETAQHALHDPEVDLVYLATFGATAGTTYKYVPLIDTLLAFYTPSAGQQAHRVGIGTPIPTTGTEVLIPTSAATPGGVWWWTQAAGWQLRNTGLPSGWRWWQVTTNPVNRRDWLLLGDNGTNPTTSGGYQQSGGQSILWRTTDSGATWTAIPVPLASPTGSSEYTAKARYHGYDSQGNPWLALTIATNSVVLWRWDGTGMVVAATDLNGGTNQARVWRGGCAGVGGEIAAIIARGSSGGGIYTAYHRIGDTTLTYPVTGIVSTRNPSRLDRTTRRVACTGSSTLATGRFIADYRTDGPSTTGFAVVNDIGCGGSDFGWTVSGDRLVIRRVDPVTVVSTDVFTCPRQVFAMEADEQTKTIIAAGYSGSGVSGVAYSTDGGATWQTFAGPTGGLAAAIAVIN